MDGHDEHLTAAMILAYRRGEISKDELLAFLLGHVHKLCTECHTEIQVLETVSRTLQPCWLNYKLWTLTVNGLEAALPVERERLRQAAREVQKLRRLDTWTERFECVRRSRRWFRSEYTVLAVLEEARTWLFRRSDEAIEWAHLAWEIAHKIGDSGQDHAVSWALAVAHQANALRVAGRLEESAELFAHCYHFAKQRLKGEPYAMAEVSALYASLLRDRGHYSDSIRLLVPAIRQYGELGELEYAGQEMVTLANTCLESGAIREAVDHGRRALVLLHGTKNNYVELCAIHTLCVSLTEDDQCDEAERLYRRHHFLYEQFTDDRTQGLRLWLEGRLAMGRGRFEQAAERFLAARHRFLHLEMSYDAARVGLEWALALWASGEVRETETAASKMLAEFRKLEGMNRQAAAALTLFVKAAKARKITLSLVRSLSRFLAQSRRRPNDLTFQYQAEE